MPSLLPRVRNLVSCTHYHQAAGRHPIPRTLEAGVECIELVTGGRGWVETSDGQWRPVEAGDAIWQVAGDQTIGRSEFTDPYRCLSVSFEVAADGERPGERFSRWDDLAAVTEFTRQAVAWWADQRLDRDAVASAIYGRLLTEAQRWALGSVGGDLPEPVAKVRAWIDANHHRDLPVADLAKEAGWSTQHLHARFRQHLGTSPHQYQLARRLQAARELLAGSDLPVAEVAQRTGFGAAAALCRAFRTAMGMSPGAYRVRRW